MKGLRGSFGRYQILGHWASGRTSEVYAVCSELLPDARAIYALKIMGESDLAAGVCDRIAANVVATERFSHAQIAQIHDAFVHQGRACIVTDFVPGEPLAQILKTDGEPLSQVLAIALAIEIATVLHEAHQRRDSTRSPLVHGDVCPENVIIRYDGRFKLVNFGLTLTEARLRPDRRATRGHFAYYSPERALGARTDAASDVYSVGLILWELLAGRPALPHAGDAEMLRQAMQPRVPSLSKHARVNQAVEEVVHRAIASSRSERYESAADLVTALAALKGSRVTTCNTRAELEKVVERRFGHRARAMKTLLERWSAQLAPGSDEAPGQRSPRRTSAVGPSPAARARFPSAPSQIGPASSRLPSTPGRTAPAPAPAPSRLPSTPNRAAPAQNRLPSTPGRAAPTARREPPALPPPLPAELPIALTPEPRLLEARGLSELDFMLDVPGEGGPTDDLAARATRDLPRTEAPRMSFVTGFALSLAGAALLSVSSVFWPLVLQRLALRIADALGDAGTTVLGELARLLTALAR
ncbi:MAG: protein kinase [Deltaproteobacteria bacterium]|nr:protein kinase [Deltaproteobacteria bacterium]